MAVELHSKVAIYQETQLPMCIQDWPMTESSQMPAIRHNFQHDVESIFWILTWIVFTHIPRQDCTHITANLFHSRSPEFATSRQNFLLHWGACHKSLESLRSDLPPMLTSGLLTMRAILHNHYLWRKLSIDDLSSYSPIYGLFRKVLDVIATSVPRGTVPLLRPPPPVVGTRSGYAPRTETLVEKQESPEDTMLAPHKAVSLKHARGASDADKVGEESRAAKRPARE
ncbi:hypothetical protein BV20DRAFT_94861 [Pilatotrama ljubarskyi]|nr:hypothetical protein BV20DRAFT_94861 [Pilatotrama ljubarskyi]